MRRRSGVYDKLLKPARCAPSAQLSAALKVAKDKDLPAYQVLQPEYNLYDRASYEHQG